MAFVNFRSKENSEKCEKCRMNFVNKYKIDEKGYIHYLNLDSAVIKTMRAAMWMSCKVCPIRKDFEKMHGVEPVAYYSAALN
jgi:transcription elongation factor Elf1